MNNILMRTVFVFLLILSFFLPHSAFALDAPSAIIKINGTPVATDDISKVADEDAIDIELTRPDTGTIEKYVYIWDKIDADAGLDADSTPVVDNPLDIEVIEMDGIFFSGSEYDTAWYFHVKSIGVGETSEETSFGPFYFDMTGPAGTIKLTVKDGQDPDNDSSVSSSVVFEIISIDDLSKVYLSNSASKPVTAIETITEEPITYPYELPEFETAPEDGIALVYVWFEDNVGNITSTSIELTIDASRKIQPEGNLNLEIEGTLEFAVPGDDSETFDWSIVDATTGGASTAAAFVGDSIDVSTVTITGVTEGDAVKVKAISTSDAAEYTSGEITIIEKSQAFCLDIDDNGVVDAFTDGFLIVRYLFGFPGAFLIDGVVGAGANRTTADDIIAYLDAASASLALDIDDNGVVDAFTDGFLIVRYLFGFPGSFLIDGVVGAGANRTTADDIIAYLDAAKCGL